MEDYKGFNIPDKIIIVSKDLREYDYDKHEYVFTGEKSGYVVLPNNKSMLESALNWANVKYSFDDKDKRVYEDYDNHVHEYDNGKFSVRVVDSADRSSQGGKLSFWTCEISYDNDKYFIGVNSDLLCDFIINNTLIDGCCDNVYLGRQKTKVGLFTSHMPMYKQAKQDEILRTRKASSKYEIGQKLFTKTNDHKVYLGEMYKLCEPYTHQTRDYGPTKHYIVVYNKPKKVYAYGNFEYRYHSKGGIYDFTKLSSIYVEDTKKSYYFNEGDTFKVGRAYDEYLVSKDRELERRIDWINSFDTSTETKEKEYSEIRAQIAFDNLRYSQSDEKLTITDEVKDIFEKYFTDYYSRIHWYKVNSYEIISEEEFEKLKENK